MSANGLKPSLSQCIAQGSSGAVEAARIAARQGDLSEARRLLRAAVRRDPRCTEAWLGLAWLAGTSRERESLLQQVLALEPDGPLGHKAQAELARLRQQAAAVSTSSRLRRCLWVLMPFALLLLLAAGLVWGPQVLGLEPLGLPWADGLSALTGAAPAPTATPAPTASPQEIAGRFVPQLQVAIAGGSWDRAVEVATIMQSLDPAGDEVRRWALETHMKYGQALVHSLEVEDAQAEFDQAVALAPDSSSSQAAHLWQETTQVYLAGRRALDAEDWPVAIESFISAQDRIPGYADALPRLVETYRRQGQVAIAAEDWPTAVQSLTLACEGAPRDSALQDLLAEAYRLQGQAAIEAQDWDHAVQVMTEAHERLPDDETMVDLLARAYRQRGIAEEGQGKLAKARADLEAALALRPQDTDAKAHLDEVMLRLFPPKKIVIDISEQRMYVYEGDNLKWRFIISTGLPGRDTATGHYKVLDKIPMAWSAIWRLKMPQWLGIYYVGRVENGIHALPIRPDGSVMWGGLLGTRQSYGCVILNNENARSLYNWAEIGTVVDIRY